MSNHDYLTTGPYMKSIIRNTYCILSCLFVLVSCNTSKLDAPINLEEKYTNKQILIRAPEYANTFNTKDPVLLELKYNSNKTITFPSNYNVKAFEESKDGWIEIDEKPVISNLPDKIVLSPHIELPLVQVVSFFPNLPNINRKYKLRIFVIGEMIEEGETTVQVSAYTDVVLRP